MADDTAKQVFTHLGWAKDKVISALDGWKQGNPEMMFELMCEHQRMRYLGIEALKKLERASPTDSATQPIVQVLVEGCNHTPENPQEAVQPLQPMQPMQAVPRAEAACVVCAQKDF